MTKQPTTYAQQIALLRERGCIINDDAFCERVLSRVNYYRLTAYLLPYRESGKKYTPGVEFEKTYRTYEFDCKLRHILFSGIEEVELYFRASIAYYHAHKYGALGYMDDQNYNQNKHNHNTIIEHFNREIGNNERALFVQHHINNYNGEFPIWVAVELFTFGMLSLFYSDLHTSDQKEIARLLDENYSNVESWLACCTDLRNICAHYGRLYFRIFPKAPAAFSNAYGNANHKLFGAVFALRGLFIDDEKWNNTILTSMVALFEEYSDAIHLEHIGFPADWETVLKK
jgi:abortive infection bacteriophage resistance protein